MEIFSSGPLELHFFSFFFTCFLFFNNMIFEWKLKGGEKAGSVSICGRNIPGGLSLEGTWCVQGLKEARVATAERVREEQ